MALTPDFAFAESRAHSRLTESGASSCRHILGSTRLPGAMLVEEQRGCWRYCLNFASSLVESTKNSAKYGALGHQVCHFLQRNSTANI